MALIWTDPANMLAYPSFEPGAESVWTLEDDATFNTTPLAFAGSRVASLKSTYSAKFGINRGSTMYQDAAAVIGATYELTFYARAATGSDDATHTFRAQVFHPSEYGGDDSTTILKEIQRSALPYDQGWTSYGPYTWAAKSTQERFQLHSPANSTNGTTFADALGLFRVWPAPAPPQTPGSAQMPDGGLPPRDGRPTFVDDIHGTLHKDRDIARDHAGRLRRADDLDDLARDELREHYGPPRVRFPDEP